MELRHLRYFVTVAEELHFGRAASRLNIAQPPLSQQIRQLEEELGFPLLFRSKQRVELTEAGKIFLEECRITLAHIEKSIHAAERAHQGATGRLEIGFVGSTTYQIAPIVQNFRVHFPSVNLILHQMKTASQTQALHDGRLHLAIVRTPVRSPFLTSKVILKEKFIAALPETHPLASRSSLRMHDLADEKFIVSARNNGSIYHDAVINLCFQAGFQPHITLEAPEILTIVSFVSEGMGVALVPASFQSQKNIGVVYRELDQVHAVLEMSFVWRKDEKSQVLHQFLKLLD